MATSWLKPLHVNKGKTIAQTITDRTDYAENPDKTRKGTLVTGYECVPKQPMRNFYYGNSSMPTSPAEIRAILTDFVAEQEDMALFSVYTDNGVSGTTFTMC